MQESHSTDARRELMTCRRFLHRCCCSTQATTSASMTASQHTKQRSKPTTRCTRFTCTTESNTASITTQHRAMTKSQRNWRGHAHSSGSRNTCASLRLPRDLHRRERCDHRDVECDTHGRSTAYQSGEMER